MKFMVLCEVGMHTAFTAMLNYSASLLVFFWGEIELVKYIGGADTKIYISRSDQL